MKEPKFTTLQQKHKDTIEWLCENPKHEQTQMYDLIAYCLIKKAINNLDTYIPLWDNKKEFDKEQIKTAVNLMASEMNVAVAFAVGYKFRVRSIVYRNREKVNANQIKRTHLTNETAKYTDHYENYRVVK